MEAFQAELEEMQRVASTGGIRQPGEEAFNFGLDPTGSQPDAPQRPDGPNLLENFTQE